MSPTTPTDSISIAIVGSGIIDTVLALDIKIYEHSPSHRILGAGISFTANARKCLSSLLDPRLEDCVTAIASLNGEYTDRPNNHMHFVDGYTTHDHDSSVSHRIPKPGVSSGGVLEGVMRVLPGSVVEFGSRVEGMIEPDPSQDAESSGKIKLMTAEADIANPTYTHKFAYRGLVLSSLAKTHLGPSLALNQHKYGGPHAHVLTFLVAKQTLLNIVAFVHDPDDWPLQRSMTQPADKIDLKRAIEGCGPSQGLGKWVVFDMYDYPVDTYSKGRVCVAGDAAHASSPHHGAGAGLGEIGEGKGDKITVPEKALRVFSDVRYEKSQWLVRSSREVCETYEWANSECGKDLDKGFEAVKERSHKIWYFDIEGMIAELEKGMNGQ
ncbi:hypothetical protein BJX70DRAFT_392466 [Aspergillus crustosus]